MRPSRARCRLGPHGGGARGLVAAERGDGAFLLRRDAVDAELPPLPDEPEGDGDTARRDGVGQRVPAAPRVPHRAPPAAAPPPAQLPAT